MLRGLVIPSLILISTIVAGQHLDYPDLQGAQIEVSNQTSFGINDTTYNYLASNNDISFTIPIGSEKNHLFNYKNLFKHNQLEKSVRTKLFQLQLYGDFRTRYVQFGNDTYLKPGLQLGFKGIQYRPVHTFLLYDASFTHMPSHTKLDQGLNMWSGHFGVGTVSGTNKIYYFGLYGFYSKRFNLLLPMIGFSARNTEKWESSILLPVQLRLTRKWNEKVWSDGMIYVNGNLTGFGYGRNYQGYVNELQLINLHLGKRVRYALNKRTLIYAEAGYEFYNRTKLIVDNERELATGDVPNRAYFKFSIKYNFNKHNGVGHLFEYY